MTRRRLAPCESGRPQDRRRSATLDYRPNGHRTPSSKPYQNPDSHNEPRKNLSPAQKQHYLAIAPNNLLSHRLSDFCLFVCPFKNHWLATRLASNYRFWQARGLTKFHPATFYSSKPLMLETSYPPVLVRSLVRGSSVIGRTSPSQHESPCLLASRLPVYL